jgi:flagellar motor switch protein FliM
LGNILTQAEIDELLNSISSGEDVEAEATQKKEEKQKARPYNFRTANKFQKEQVRTINMVFQTFSQLFSNLLTSILRTACECEIFSVEELSFNEFNNSLPSPVILALLRCTPMAGTQILQISPEAAYIIVNKLLGGGVSGADSSKQFTEIELTLMERVMRQMMRVFSEAWDKVFKVEAVIERIETSSQFAQIVALNDPVMLITMNITIGEESGLVSICMPYSSIEPVSKQLNARLVYSSSQEIRQSEEQAVILSDKLYHTTVELTAYFEDTPATISDVANLQVGDVIRLGQKKDSPVLMKIQHIPKFHAQIGTSADRYAIKILDVIREED